MKKILVKIDNSEEWKTVEKFKSASKARQRFLHLKVMNPNKKFQIVNEVAK